MGTVYDPDTLAVLMLYLVVSFVIFVATAGNAEGNWHVIVEDMCFAPVPFIRYQI